jgi:hypothetical protein
VIEALGRMISTAVNGGLMEGFSVGDNAFSHLLFADDALIFCDAVFSFVSFAELIPLLWSCVELKGKS